MTKYVYVGNVSQDLDDLNSSLDAIVTSERNRKCSEVRSCSVMSIIIWLDSPSEPEITSVDTEMSGRGFTRI